MDNQSKPIKRPKILVINCCGHNMRVTYGKYLHEYVLRTRMCLKCFKRVHTMQYANEDEKIVDDNILKKAGII